MAYTTPNAAYSTTINGTYANLTGIQSISIRRGRTYFQDNIPASSCVIELIPANSYATPLAIGQYLEVRTTTSSLAPAYFVGQITNVQRSYAIPYNASATINAPADRITITATGSTGQCAATTQAAYTFAFSDVTLQALEIGLAANVYTVGSGAQSYSSLISVANVGVLDVINGLARTGQFNIDDAETNRMGNPYNSGTIQPLLFMYQVTSSATVAFTDSGAGIKYNQLEFLSSNQSTFNSVNVITPGLTTQNVKAATGPYNSLDYNTYSQNTAAMANLATYLYNLLSGQTQIAPFSVNCDTAVDDTFLPYCYIANAPNAGVTLYATAIGGQVTVKFRGTTYAARIESIATNFYPDRATAQFTFSPTLGVPFTLNSSNFGILNTNRLGYP